MVSSSPLSLLTSNLSGDLKDLLKEHKDSKTPVPEDTVWSIFAQVGECCTRCLCPNGSNSVMTQIALGLLYIHDQRVLHRDMKPANVFLQKTRDGRLHVKIGDLGVARVLSTQTSFVKTVVGTPFFLSPEVAMGEQYGPVRGFVFTCPEQYLVIHPLLDRNAMFGH